MSRINFGAKPYMYPQPVLILGTYDKEGKPNAMNAAWGMTSDYKEVSVSLGEHKTTDNLAENGDFTLSFGTEDTMLACDYVGVISGRTEKDKLKKSGLHAFKSENVNAPLFEELPMALECRMKSIENGILIGEIINVCADESILTDGKTDPAKLKPICFDPVNNTYMSLGRVVGNAFKDGLKLK